ncbi:MAG: hypothetical protein J6S81_08270, partial [Treponema sp.]|nr:hypothetical protein [Treponema sp.]
MFAKENNRLVIKDWNGTVWIEPWGKDSVRVRMTADRKMDDNDWALEGESLPPGCTTLQPTPSSGVANTVPTASSSNDEHSICNLPRNAPACSIEIQNVDTTYPWAKYFDNVEKTSGQTATLTNGRLQVRVNHEGWISFWQLEQNTTNKADSSSAISSSSSTSEPQAKLLFEEQWRNRARIDRFCVPTNNPGRELKHNPSTFNFKATVRFEA